MSDRVQLKKPSHTGDTQSPQSIFTPVKPSFTPTTQPTQAPPLGHDFSRISIQPKLTVSQPDDPYEREADRVAGEVMRMGDPMMSGGGVMRSPQDNIHRQCDDCEDEEEVQTKLVDSVVQRKAVVMRSTDEEFQAGSNVESQLSSSKGGGSQLPDEVRSFMEPRFGVNFSQVRVHTSSEAVQMNQDLNAQAFAHKQDIYFGAGKSPAKDALTAHELTHVVQQSDKTHLKLAIQKKPTPADKAQAEKVAKMSADFNIAVKQSEWQVAGEVLNGFNREDIVARLKKLNNTQILQIKDGAIKNPKVGPDANVVKVIAEFSPLIGGTAIETLSFHLSDGPYAWDANYDIWMMGKTVFARLRINLVAGAGVTANKLKKLQKTWEKAQDKWSGQYKLVDSSDAESQYSVEVIVQFVKTDVDQTVTVRPGPARSDMTDWDTKDDKHAASHEMGHMLGQKDEYADPSSPSRTVTDSSSIMNTNTGKVQKAHYQNFATWLSSKTSKTFVVK